MQWKYCEVDDVGNRNCCDVDDGDQKCCDGTDGALVSTFLSSGLDFAKEELRSSWWTRARRYRNGTSRLDMRLPGAAAEVKVGASLGEMLSRRVQH